MLHIIKYRPGNVLRILMEHSLFSESKCLLWLGTKDTEGYGIVTIDEEPEQVHRLSMYVYADFKLLGVDSVMHLSSCAKHCWNPAHLSIIKPGSNRLCKHCHIRYIKVREHQKYCSDKCRWLAWLQKQALKQNTQKHH